MKHEGKIYVADEGKTFKRKADQKIMGPELRLKKYIDGTEDKISNYSEIKDPYYVPPVVEQPEQNDQEQNGQEQNRQEQETE